mmetsp:Transcript_95160/g.268897  ORF Transcript_95160/g.268897 Transcript_95160/m.268897 type:complete len:674 (-) Transcript_95160:284-2305(-)
MSDSEDSRPGRKAHAKEELDVPEGAVLAERADAGGSDGVDVTKKETASEGAGNKPSNTLYIRSLPKDLDADDLEMRLQRFGDLVSCQKDGEGKEVFVVKYHKTNCAYQAREKLNGSTLYGCVIQVDFGPQDADHYNRSKKRTQGRGKKDFLDSGVVADVGSARAGGRAPNTSKKVSATVSGDVEAVSGKRRASDAVGEDAARDDKVAKMGDSRVMGSIVAPSKQISRWSETLTFEEQLEDFMKMPRRGMYNRYLVLGKLPPELRTGSAIWNMVAPVQRDIMHIEMLTCFGKPVAHVALRSATAAAAMHRIAEQIHSNLTVAFAPPRKASKALWLGNVDDFVNRKELEVLLGEFGKNNGLRYLPARTCAFVTFNDVVQAVKARNTIYGLEVQKNQYLNVDFVDEWAAEAQEAAWGAWNMPPVSPWGAPMPPGPWGMMPGAPPPWQQQQQQKGGRRGDQHDARGPPGFPAMPMPPGYPGMWGYSQLPASRPNEREGKDAGNRRSRTRSPRRRNEPSAQHARRRGPSPVAAAAPRRGQADSESEVAEPKVPKSKVKLYKMGEFCCHIVANYVKGKDDPDALMAKLHIDQRTKIDHCKSHLDRAGDLATIWHFSAADRKDCAAYDALCDYFVEKQRVGLVQTPSCYVYIVPPTEKYLKELKIANSNYVVGIQIPIKK